MSICSSAVKGVINGQYTPLRNGLEDEPLSAVLVVDVMTGYGYGYGYGIEVCDFGTAWNILGNIYILYLYILYIYILLMSVNAGSLTATVRDRAGKPRAAFPAFLAFLATPGQDSHLGVAS